MPEVFSFRSSGIHCRLFQQTETKESDPALATVAFWLKPKLGLP